jgi:hypothetical protein
VTSWRYGLAHRSSDFHKGQFACESAYDFHRADTHRIKHLLELESGSIHSPPTLIERIFPFALLFRWNYVQAALANHIFVPLCSRHKLAPAALAAAARQ